MPGIKDISDLISDLSANKLSNLEELKLREVQNMIRQAQEGNLEFFKNFRKPDDAMKFYAGEGGQKKLEEFQSGDWGKQFTDEDKEEIYQSIMDQRSGGMLSKLFREMDAKIDVKGKGMADINRMTAPLGYAHGGFEDRMSMLKKAMMDTEEQRRADMATGDPEMERDSTFGTITEDNIFDVAMTIARQQRDTSEENIKLIINQLMALTPSMEQTMRKELTPVSTKGLKYLFDKLNVATGRKSDPRLNRSVGFGRVE